MSLLNRGSPLIIHEDGPITCPPSVSDRLLDVKETAALLNVPESWIYQHVRARAGEKLPHFKLGKYIRFSAKALMHWLETRHLGGEEPSLVGQDGFFRGRR
jgi:excisionase family DNA binding protein